MNEEIVCNAEGDEVEIEAPELPYLPPKPRSFAGAIGLVGCGGIAPYHLAAYRAGGFSVAALCDVDRTKAEALSSQYWPTARVTDRLRDVLDDASISVVDIATHPEGRGALIEAALNAGKHVLSQKPFVSDLREGERLARLAEEKGLQLAVNQNGRWAPHFSYLRHAIAAGLIGEVSAINCVVQWDHSWTAGTAFDEIPHLVLYDFGIHWFDMVMCFMGHEAAATSVYATVTRSAGQRSKPPMVAHAIIEFEHAHATLAFHGDTQVGAQDTTRIVGSEGVLESRGVDLNHQRVTLHTAKGRAEPKLEGDWFTNGFQGTMGELLSAIDEERPAYNAARSVLNGHRLCFAAVHSAETGRGVNPASIEALQQKAFDGR